MLFYMKMNFTAVDGMIRNNDNRFVTSCCLIVVQNE